MKRFSLLSSNTACTRVGAESLQDVAEALLKSTWSCGLFRDDYRNLKNFELADLFAIDVDAGCTINEARLLFAGHKHIIATTRNHLKPKNGIVCERFRVVLVLDRAIVRMEDNYATFEALKAQFPFIDPACGDASRMFYPCVELISVNEDGLDITARIADESVATANRQSGSAELLPASTRGRLATSTTRFCVEGAPVGERHKALVKALLDFKQNGYSQAEASRRLEHLELMDAHAWKTVEDIFENRQPRHPARIPENGAAAPDHGIEAWARSWLAEKNVACSYSGIMYMGAEPVGSAALLRKMRNTRRGTLESVQKDGLDDALMEWIEERRAFHLNDVRSRLSGYSKAGEDELRKLITAMCGADSKRHELYHDVIRHSIWQIKRKLFHLPVEHHLMAIFYGPQGSGKTTAVNKLLEPLSDLVSRPNGFECVRDDRSARIFIDHPVIFFDEMAQAERADVNILKNYISSPLIEYRPMGTNARDRGRNMATLVGASNRRVAEIVMDDTGARRFFEIATLARCDWATINAINFDLIWKAADEASNESPIRRHLEEVTKIQNTEFRNKGPVEMWIEEYCLVVGGSEWTPAGDLLSAFNDWYSGSSRYNAKSFSLALARLGIENKHTRAGNGWNLSSPKGPALRVVGGDF